MSIIKEDYVSFETAKLLKEKGFNEECFALYNPDGILIQSGIRLNNSQVGRVKGSYSAPTLQMAMKWLREIQSMPINVLYNPVYYYHYKFQVCLGAKEKSNARRYDTYEQACEVAIKYCLEHLI